LAIQYYDIEFSPIQAGSVFLGTEKGGWIYSGQRPRHEVQCPDYYVMKTALSQNQLQQLLQREGENILLSGERIEKICMRLSEGFEAKNHGLDPGKSWEIRCPSEGEWRYAHEQIQFELTPGKIEVLADSVSNNYRGAMMDGRPRTFTGIGPMAEHRAAIETHPTQEGITALSSAPMDRELRDLTIRLVITPVRESEPICVPHNADLAANIRGEMFWTFVLGILPSFVIPIARGMGSYATDGWANLLFGGLCAGFATGAVWRPRRPTIFFDDIAKSIITGGRD
jgi:hypothetical protein